MELNGGKIRDGANHLFMHRAGPQRKLLMRSISWVLNPAILVGEPGLGGKVLAQYRATCQEISFYPMQDSPGLLSASPSSQPIPHLVILNLISLLEPSQASQWDRMQKFPEKPNTFLPTHTGMQGVERAG